MIADKKNQHSGGTWIGRIGEHARHCAQTATYINLTQGCFVSSILGLALLHF